MKFFLFFLLFPVLVFSQDTISKAQLSIISLDKVKVVYRGVDNPITVAVANAKEYWVSGPGVSETDELGKYIVRPGSGTELKIIVAIKLQDNSIVTEEHVYQIKGLPMPISTLNSHFSTQGYLEFSIDELKDAKVGVKFVDFLFKYSNNVSQFTIIIPKHEPLTIEGNIINEEALGFIKKAKKKDYIIINSIKQKGSELICTVSASTLIFKIVERYNPKK
ncbi:GldM family protein [uncultured Flavobacterium sp.]|uniref:GldM family protein n=1 Tax=uncultured Flavobacterium sp. TaxID=165435 RepID=UPI0030EB69A4|tara:strand:+ start:3205 stop:3864 length:660 start_codon:yes stop_codon:yes gene_type:complete